MCLILFSYKNHPEFKLVLAANRDEFYARPTQTAHWRPEDPNVLAGKDLQAGGSWLGVTRSGRIAALTNYRGGGRKPQNPPSRGEIVSDFLFEKEPGEKFPRRLVQNGRRYRGFNVIIGEMDRLYYFSNRNGNVEKIEPGVHGLSNHVLDTPWPKVKKGMAALEKALFSPSRTRSKTSSSQGGENGQSVNPPLVESLFKILSDGRVAPDADLPDTGVGLDLERVLSPLFIQTPAYGTRASTVILVDKENNVYFEERSYIPKAVNQFHFKRKLKCLRRCAKIRWSIE